MFWWNGEKSYAANGIDESNAGLPPARQEWIGLGEGLGLGLCPTGPSLWGWPCQMMHLSTSSIAVTEHCI